jgi:hypothetical protein
MSNPEWVMPGVVGAAVGATVGVMIFGAVGFSWGGWMTGAEAGRVSREMAHETMIAALVPVCVDMSRVDTDREAKLATIRDASNDSQREAVMDAGWATVPGAERPDHDLAQACMAALDLDHTQ